ncbi:MAG: hypothetical protein J6N53_05560 [Lachnospiraceae bacterium]|nr:hypothetical protein [Lachnospiraceae bacterium]
MAETPITLEQFISNLWNGYEKSCSSSDTAEEAQLFYATIRSAFSTQQLKAPALRRDAARILHIFLLQIAKLPDEDWGEYTRLKDLYDCRICANAIAQVCVRSLLHPVSRTEFGSLRPLSEHEASDAIECLLSLL